MIDTNARGGNYAEVINLSKEECDKMVSKHVYTTKNGNSVTINLDQGGRMSFSYTSWGRIDDAGSCESGPVLSKNGHTYDHHTRNTRLELLYTRGTGRLAVEQKMLILPNGVQCGISLESCELADYGQVFWQQPTPQCKSEVGEQSLVYKGPATLITNTNTSEAFVHVSFSGHHFQIKLEKRFTYICGFKSSFTEHPKLFVTMLDPAFPDFPLTDISSSDVNMMNYINSKLVYSMRHVKEQVMTLYRLFERERCVMQNRITSNLLTLAILSPREFAYQYFGEPGYTAVVRGEVVHIAKCDPVPVIPKPLLLCYNELPVEHNNKTRFMTPRTRILTDVGTIVDCTTDLGTRFKLNGRWITLTFGGMLSVEGPKIITPDPLSYEFETMEEMISGGLYTKEVIQSYQQILTSPIEESIISARVTTALRGGDPIPSGYYASNIFNHEDMEQLKSRVKSSISDMLETLLILGNWFSVVAMIGWTLNSLISMINCGINYHLLKPETGVFFAFFTCCFSSIYNLLSHKRNKPLPNATSELDRNNDLDDEVEPSTLSIF